MRLPWIRRPAPDDEHLQRAQREADALTVRGHRVAQSLEDRLARNHFATVVAQTMRGTAT